MEPLLIYIAVESIVTPIICSLSLILSIWMAKKFGGMFKKFFVIFAIAWIFQILHSIDETFLVQAMPNMMPQEMLFKTFPEIFSQMGEIPSPLFMMLGLRINFFLVKMSFMVLCAGLIAYALYVHHKITTGKKF